MNFRNIRKSLVANGSERSIEMEMIKWKDIMIEWWLKYILKKSIDFNEIFSPVVRLTTIRMVLEMFVAFDLHLEQLNVKTAFFFHGELEEEIYMLQPKVFKEKENFVYRLDKSLYGLKLVPRC